MKKIFLTLIILIIGFITSYSQINMKYLESIDTIQGDFYSNFSENNDSIIHYKRYIVRELKKISNDNNLITIDTTDLSSFNIQKTRFDDCENFPLFLLRGFDTYLFTYNLKIGLIDILLIGQNTPPFYNSKTGIGYFTKSKSIINDCRSLETIRTLYKIKNDQTLTIVNRDTIKINIDFNGKIKKE